MLRSLVSRLRGTFTPGDRESRLGADIEEHLAALTEANVSRGMSEHEARLAARREFGPLEAMKEGYRDQARFRLFESIARDLKFALRQCRRKPAFTLLAILSLALGIGANTALFSFVDAILLKRLPVPDPQRLVVAEGRGGGAILSYTQIRELDRNATHFDGIFGRHPIDVSVSTGDQPQWVAGELVTSDYYRTLRVAAARGQLLGQKDLENAAGNPVCDVSYRFWQDVLHGDPNVVGRELRINMRRYRIAGVTEQGFTGPDMQAPVDIQLPATRLMDFMPAFAGMSNFDWKRQLSMFFVMGRLRQGVNVATGEAELSRLTKRYSKNEPVADSADISLVSGEGGIDIGNWLGEPATILLAVSGLVLLVACANLATLLLSRTSARETEFAIRLAIGCSRKRIAGQVMTESALLAVCGGAAGIGLAWVVRSAILGYLNRTTPAIHQIHVNSDPRVLWFAMGLCGLCVLLFGTAPALQAAGSARIGCSVRTTGSGAMVRKVFVAAQVALSLVVLFSAGLLIRTVSGLQTVDLGYRPDEIAVIDMRPAAGGYAGQRANAFYSELTDRVRAIPGIKAAATTIGVSMTDPATEKLPPRPNQKAVAANIYAVSSGYFSTIGAHLIAGRDFNGNDIAGKQAVVIINAHLARAYFGNEDPIGRSIIRDDRKGRVIGVVSDVRDQGLRNTTANTVYEDTGQLLASSLTLLARCDGSCGPLMGTLRESVAKTDPNTPLLSMHTMQTEISGTLASEHILSFLSGLFGALAVLLTTVGLYGVTSYAVTRRTREIGLRVAIGASVRHITALLLKETAMVVLAGICVGVPAALAAVQLIRSQLFGVTAHDPVTLLTCVLGIAVTAVLACAAPLRRALRIAPQEALRVD